MSDIRFEPTDGYFMVLRVLNNTPIPQRYHNIVFDGEKSDHFGAGLVRNNGEWFLLIDKFRSLPKNEIMSIRDSMNADLGKRANKTMVEIDEKTLRRRFDDSSNKFLNGIAQTPGAIIYTVALVGLNDFLLAFKYPESSTDYVDKLYFDFIDSSNFKIEVVTLGQEKGNDIPSFFRFHNLIKIDYDNLVLIKTVWRMSDEEMKVENRGIFQNEMVFKPKYFDPESSPIYGQLVAEVGRDKIKGNAEFEIVSRTESGKVVEFKFYSKWFNDFYKDVIASINGPFFYWGYSDGENELENYYVLPVRNETEFLKGLKKHWSEHSRAKHVNMIVSVENLKDIINRYGFEK